MFVQSSAICASCGCLESKITLCRKCGSDLPFCGIYDPTKHGLRQMLQSFAPPSSKEASQSISATVHDARTKINRYNSLIRRLESTRDELQKFADAQNSLLAPIRRLPSEVLNEIFQYVFQIQKNVIFSNEVIALDDNPFEIPDEGRDPSRDQPRSLASLPSLSLSQVCHQWRAVILNSPRAWTNLEVWMNGSCFDPNSHLWAGEESMQQRLLQLYLERSGNSPITVSIRPDPGQFVDEDLGKRDKALLKMLSLASNKWIGATVEARAIETLLRSDLRFQSLESFSIPDDGVIEDSPPVVGVLRDSPKLHKLDIPAQFFNPFQFWIPWDQLRTLKLRDGTLNHVERLRHVPLLEELELYHWSVSDDDQFDPMSPSRSVTLPSLKTVSILGRERDEEEAIPSTSDVLYFLEVPQLSHLKCESNGRINRLQVHDANISALVRESSCPITSLVLNDVCVLRSQIAGILEILPQLKSLSLCGLVCPDPSDMRKTKWISPIANSVWLLLAQSRPDAYKKDTHAAYPKQFKHLPYLEDLVVKDSFRGSDHNGDFIETFLSMLEERCPKAIHAASSHLRNVELTFANGVKTWKDCVVGSLLSTRLEQLQATSVTRISVYETKNYKIRKCL